MINKNKKELDYTGNKEHAFALAKRIEFYWRSRGFLKVRAWVGETMGNNGQKIYSVVSNIRFAPYAPSLRKFSNRT